MSSAREELGYTSEAMQRTGNRINWEKFESKVVKPSKEAIKNRLGSLGAQIIEERGQDIILKLQNRKIELWCETDCYYLESKQEYGSGILNLLNKIESHLNSQGLTNLG